MKIPDKITGAKNSHDDIEHKELTYFDCSVLVLPQILLHFQSQLLPADLTPQVV